MTYLVYLLGVYANRNISNVNVFDFRTVIRLRKWALFILNATDFVDVYKNLILNSIVGLKHVFLEPRESEAKSVGDYCSHWFYYGWGFVEVTLCLLHIELDEAVDSVAPQVS